MFLLCGYKDINMMNNEEKINQLMKVLNESQREYKYVLHFTPRPILGRIPGGYEDKRFTHWLGDDAVDIRYGYYEIKDSPVGPIMMFLKEYHLQKHEDFVRVKVRANKWDIWIHHFEYRVQNAVYKFIRRTPVVQSKLSEEEAGKLFDRFCDIRMPKLARKNLKLKLLEKEVPWDGLTGEQRLALLEAYVEAIRKANNHFELDDFDITPESDVPYISLIAPLAVGAAMKVAPMIQYVLMNAHQM